MAGIPATTTYSEAAGFPNHGRLVLMVSTARGLRLAKLDINARLGILVSKACSNHGPVFGPRQAG